MHYIVCVCVCVWDIVFKKMLVFVVVQVFELGNSFFPSKGVVSWDAKKHYNE